VYNQAQGQQCKDDSDKMAAFVPACFSHNWEMLECTVDMDGKGNSSSSGVDQQQHDDTALHINQVM
jgi:hypothetical protein